MADGDKGILQKCQLVKLKWLIPPLPHLPSLPTWVPQLINTFTSRGLPSRPVYWFFPTPPARVGAVHLTLLLRSPHPVRAEGLVCRGNSSPIGRTGPGRACIGRFQNTRYRCAAHTGLPPLCCSLSPRIPGSVYAVKPTTIFQDLQTFSVLRRL